MRTSEYKRKIVFSLTMKILKISKIEFRWRGILLCLLGLCPAVLQAANAEAPPSTVAEEYLALSEKLPIIERLVVLKRYPAGTGMTNSIILMRYQPNAFFARELRNLEELKQLDNAPVLSAAGHYDGEAWYCDESGLTFYEKKLQLVWLVSTNGWVLSAQFLSHYEQWFYLFIERSEMKELYHVRRNSIV